LEERGCLKPQIESEKAGEPLASESFPLKPMSLTRTIPIEDLIFTDETIRALLEEMGKFYRKPEEKYFGNTYRLSISEDETTTYSSDAPPEDLSSMLNRPIRRLSLRIDCYEPIIHFELTLHHGEGAILNSIRLDGEDHQLVNAAYTSLSSILSRVTPQSTFIKKYGIWCVFPMMLLIGWPLKNLYLRLLLWAGQAKLTPWTWELFWSHILTAEVLGFVPACVLLYCTAKAYPAVEIQTGPAHLWKQANRRKWMKGIFAFAVMGPLGKVLYDLYRFLA
jgi:hypothetical protein